MSLNYPFFICYFENELVLVLDLVQFQNRNIVIRPASDIPRQNDRAFLFVGLEKFMKTLNYYSVFGQNFFLDFSDIERVGDDIRLAPGLWISGDTPVRRPNFRSNAGHAGWVKTLVDEIYLTPAQADVALRCRGDISWVLSAPEEALESIAELGAFSSHCLKDQNKGYIPFYRDMSFKDWSRNKLFFDTGLVKSLSSVKFFHALGISPEMILRVGPNWRSLSKERLLAKATGASTPIAAAAVSLTKERRTVYDLKPADLLEAIAPVSKSINASYWKVSHQIDDLLKAGVQPIELLPFMTKKEANKYVSSPDRYKEVDRGSYFTPNKRTLKWLMEYRHGVGRVPFWVHDYAKSVLVAEWAMRHLGPLSKVRTIYGPGGQVLEFHQHTLLEHITDDMLPRGIKTGWEVVEAMLEQVAAKSIADQLNEDRELPKLPPLKRGAPAFDEVVQIASTHALRDEGVRMSHCVGAYIRSCDSKRSYILHVEDGTERGATVEVCPVQGGGWRVQQAMGPGNVLSPKAWQIAERYISYLS